MAGNSLQAKSTKSLRSTAPRTGSDVLDRCALRGRTVSLPPEGAMSRSSRAQPAPSLCWQHLTCGGNGKGKPGVCL